MSASNPLILLTNDDGIFSEGLTALASSLSDLGELYVVAPDRERNAMSHSLTLGSKIYVQGEGPRKFSTTGTPTDCVNIGVHRLVPRRPDLVVSGMNLGPNLCEDVTYSGTVAAALEARMLGIPSIAFSLATREEYAFLPASRVARSLVEWLLENDLPDGVFLNVNIPNFVDGSQGEVCWSRLGHKHYGDFLEEGVDETGRPFYRYGRDTMQYLEDGRQEDADWRVVEQGHVSVTPLRLDGTDEDFLARQGPFHAPAVGARASSL